MKNCRRGFTLVELMIIMAIIGILVSIIIPGFGNYRYGVVAEKIIKKTALSEREKELYKEKFEEIKKIIEAKGVQIADIAKEAADDAKKVVEEGAPQSKENDQKEADGMAQKEAQEYAPNPSGAPVAKGPNNYEVSPPEQTDSKNNSESLIVLIPRGYEVKEYVWEKEDTLKCRLCSRIGGECEWAFMENVSRDRRIIFKEE